MRILCVWSGMVSSAYETLITSPGESLTVVCGPGGFGKGGSGLWHAPHMSAAQNTGAKRREDRLEPPPLRSATTVPGNCRLFDIPLLSWIMQGRLLYKLVIWQDKSAGEPTSLWEVDCQ